MNADGGYGQTSKGQKAMPFPSCFALLRSLFSNISLQVHRLSSVRPRYLQANPNLCLPVFLAYYGERKLILRVAFESYLRNHPELRRRG